MSRDMSGRLEPIYSAMLVRPGKAGPGGTTLYAFNEKSGYLNEVLAVAIRPDGETFVARCLVGESAAESLAPCERDVHVGDNLSLSYRFPQRATRRLAERSTRRSARRPRRCAEDRRLTGAATKAAARTSQFRSMSRIAIWKL